MISFELQGGFEVGKVFMNKFQFCIFIFIFGDVDILVFYLVIMLYCVIVLEVCWVYGISDGLVRIFVGIEDVVDILFDLEQVIG